MALEKHQPGELNFTSNCHQQVKRRGRHRDWHSSRTGVYKSLQESKLRIKTKQDTGKKIRLGSCCNEGNISNNINSLQYRLVRLSHNSLRKNKITCGSLVHQHKLQISEY